VLRIYIEGLSELTFCLRNSHCLGVGTDRLRKRFFENTNRNFSCPSFVRPNEMRNLQSLIEKNYSAWSAAFMKRFRGRSNQIWEGRESGPLLTESRIAQTALGPIEYYVMGTGPAVLVSHGCPGGYDQGLIAARLARDQRFQFIALSRPGYLRTPLCVGASPAEQADAYAALLDALHIPAAAVIGISAGGPSALQFALRHPRRCWALVTLCAISRRLSQAEIMKCKSLLTRLTFTAILLWELIRYRATELANRCRALLAFMSPDSGSEYRLPTRRNLDVVLGLLGNFRMMSLRKAGLENDLEQLTRMPVYPLEEITTPTLVLHGQADELVPFSHAEAIANKVPKARILEVQDGGHLFCATHHQQVIPAIFEFLKQSAQKLIPASS
jgi:pimeloyl-ACP methyl ester carboxylesterase